MIFRKGLDGGVSGIGDIWLVAAVNAAEKAGVASWWCLPYNVCFPVDCPRRRLRSAGKHMPSVEGSPAQSIACSSGCRPATPRKG